MSEETNYGQSDGESGIDMGEPVRELAGFEHEPSGTFLAIVRSKIQRRSTVSQIASFTWNVPKVILAEFWNALVQVISPHGAKKEGKS
jgi:hypothetical protein